MRHNARPRLKLPSKVIESAPATSASDYVRWFRGSTPYVSAHQGKTFVVVLSGEVLASENCMNVVHDLALVSVLGVRLVVVHGARPQITQALSEAGMDCPVIEGVRVTPFAAMDHVRRVCAGLRSQIEGLFSQGLPQTPLHKTRIGVLGGNLVTARPFGTLAGVSYQHTGVVRRIDRALIQDLLAPARIVLLSPFGYSPWGELYNLESEQLAARTAGAIKADKLILFTEEEVIFDAAGKRLSEAGPQGIQADLDKLVCGETTKRSLKLAAHFTQEEGIPTHLIGGLVDGALLQELFTAGGQGTRISQSLGSRVRTATSKDVAAILAMTAPLADEGVLKRRDPEAIERMIDDYLITEVDGLVAGCCAVSLLEACTAAELSCLVVHPNFRESAAGDALLDAAVSKAVNLGASDLVALTTHAHQWFRERGFAATEVDGLPVEIRNQCEQRKSTAFVRHLGAK